MEKLFNEFKPVSKAEWVKKILADLKGKSEDILHYQAEMDLGFQSTYHLEDQLESSFLINKPSNEWKNRMVYGATNNAQILKDLNEGVDALSFRFENQENFEKITASVQFQFVNADVRFDDLKTAHSFKGDQNLFLNCDIFSMGLAQGEWKNKPSEFVDYYRSTKAHKNVWVNGSSLGDAGATTIQELAFTCNLLNEYVQVLVDASETPNSIREHMVIELSVTEDYFVNIAKFKVIRQLVDLVFSAYDDSLEPYLIPIYATTSSRFLAENDANNNLLRQTTQCMSALIGGADVITVKQFDGDNAEISQRMSKNIPLVLREEVYLDKVVDASEGSYFVQNLCNDMLTKSWELFKQVETLGGFCAAVEQNFIQNEIEKNRDYLINQVNQGKKTFLGINKYQSTLESWKEVSEQPKFAGTSFKSLQAFKVEAHFKKALHEQKDI